MPVDTATRLSVAQAALAGALPDLLGVELAPDIPDDAVDGGVVGRDHLGLVGGGVHAFGYPFVSELLVLEDQFLRPDTPANGDTSDDETSDDESASGSGLTVQDEAFSELTAFVHDHLLNPALPLARRVPSIGTTETMDTVYERVLRHAEFAGRVVPESAAHREAESLLFDRADDGTLSDSAVLQRYREFEQRVDDARDELDQLTPDDADAFRRARDKLSRLEAEWGTVGQRGAVEEAFRVLELEARTANFEDERRELLTRFEAARTLRIDAPGVAYSGARLAPVGPLLDEAPADAASGWQDLTLDADGVRDILTDQVRDAFNLDADNVEAVLADLVQVRCHWTVVTVVRDWLDQSFLTAPWWRLAGQRQLADGTGDGTMPVIPQRLLFVRGVEVTHHGGLTVTSDGDASTDTSPTRQVTNAVAAIPKMSDLVLSEAVRNRLQSSMKVLQAERARDERKLQVAPVTTAPGFFPAKMVDDKVLAARPKLKAFRAAAIAGSTATDDAEASAEPATLAITSGAVDTAAARVTARAAEPRVRVRPNDDNDDDKDDNDDRDHTRVTARRASRPSTRRSTGGIMGVVKGLVRRDRGDAKPRVRDHRGGRGRPSRPRPRRPKVRDHRAPALDVKVIIQAGDDVAQRRLPEVSAQVHDGATVDEARASDPDDGRMEFHHRAGEVDDLGDTVTVVLVDARGGEIARHDVDVVDGTVEVQWRLVVQDVVEEFTRAKIPNLYGYVLHALPRSPNPDESLPWPGDDPTVDDVDTLDDGDAGGSADQPPADSNDAPPPAPDLLAWPLPDGHALGTRDRGPRVHSGHDDDTMRDQVRWVQQRLVAHGHAITVDGLIGPETDGALRAFQSSAGLQADGLVGPKTWTALAQPS